MLRILLSILFFLVISPVYSGEFENAINNNSKVLLYLYTDECRYCRMFNPIYTKLEKEFGSKCKFLKINSYTKEGRNLMINLNAVFVPNIIMFNTKKNEMARVQPNCYLNYSCISNAIDVWINK